MFLLRSIPRYSNSDTTIITSPGRSFDCLLLLMFSLALLPVAAKAQNVQHTQNKPDMALRSNLRVDPSTLGMSIQIPLAQYPGRAGTSVPLGLYYNSKVWRIEYDDFVNGNMSNCSNPPVIEVGTDCYTTTRALYAENSIAGWTFSNPLATIEWTGERYNGTGRPIADPNQGGYIARLTVRFPDGATHELRKSDAVLFGTDPQTGTYHSVDSSRLKYVGTSPGAGILYLPDGSRYEFANWAASQYVDRNGNVITSQRDTLGRQFMPPGFHNGFPHTESHLVKGVGAVDIAYSFDLRQLGSPGVLEPDMITGLLPALRRVGDRDKFGHSLYSPSLFVSDPDNRVINPENFNPVVLHKIILPNGTSYTFTYNEYGEIARVTYPTGGYERYRYGQIQPLAPISAPYSQANRGVLERRVSTNDPGSVEATWVYNPSGTTVSMISPDLTSTVRHVHTGYTFGTVVFGFDDPRAGMAYEERVHAPQSQGGAMLRRNLTKWESTGPAPGGQATARRDPRATKRVEILLDTGGLALARTTIYQHDADLNLIRTEEYDFVQVDHATAQTGVIDSIQPGTLIRSSEATFLVNDPAIDIATRNGYRARHLISLTTSTRIKNAQEAIVAQSSIKYDENGPLAQLNDYPTVPGWTDPQSEFRGNVTTTGNWLNTTGAYIETHNRYDQCGNVRFAWDAEGNQSHVEYADSFRDGINRNTFAYPTRTVSPIPDPAGVHGSSSALVTSSQYDFSSGLVTSTTDVNNRTNTLEYAPTDALGSPNPLQRLTRVTRADGGWTAYAYNDQPGDLFLRTRTALDAASYTESTEYFDGLGRSWRSVISEGATSIFTDLRYDAMGRAYQTSNPYRTGESVIWTSTGFDPLGRVIRVTTPDNARVTTNYRGNSITVYDQAGKQRMSVTDALGRLMRVYEAPDDTSYNYVTSYDYDVLDNLIKVTQGSQARYFMYDSLKRLQRARNPEQNLNSNLVSMDPLTGNSQWSIAYTYDGNGNLKRKTDARGIASFYDYDALNRNIKVDYSDTTGVNPDITRTYDAATNGKGRLSESYAGGNETVGAIVEHTKIVIYDALGRPEDQRQRFKTNGAWSAEYKTKRGHNLAGAVTLQTYPSGRTVSYTYDNAGRNSSFTGYLGDDANRTYTSGILYSAMGGMTKEQFGTDTPVYNKSFYNSRGQLSEIRLSTSYTGPADTTWNRGAIINHYSNACWGMCGGSSSTTSMPDNNGNLRKQDVYVPLNDQLQNAPQTSWWQGYDYDSVNRLQRLREYTGNPAIDWQQEYVYDRWGNRTLHHSNTTGLGINKKSFTVNTANNRLGVPVGQKGTMTYDAAGNLTTDTYSGAGVTRAYDAENRMTSETQASNYLAGVYTYNADGQRVRRKVGAVETWQVYGFDGELLAEYAANTAATSPQKEYGYRNGKLLITADSSASQSSSATYKASTDFSGVQGQQNWYYLDSNGLPMTFNGQWQGPETYLVLWGSGGHPGTYADAVRQWRAPNAGSIRITGNVSDAHTSCGDGVSVSIQKGAQVLWQQIIENGNTTGFSYDLTTSVATGDHINFVINKRGDWDCDSTNFDPTITPSAGGSYNAAANFSASQNPAGAWRYGYRSLGGAFTPYPAAAWYDPAIQNAYNCPQATSFNSELLHLHPGAEGQESVVRWTAASSGTVQITGRFENLNQATTDVHVRHNTTAVFDGYVNGAGSVVPYSVQRTVAAGDTIEFVVGAGGNGYGQDSTGLSATITLTGGGGGTTAINWLVTDQLGTPRMVFDKTGSLANVKRHDYLPFGEELFAQGRRTPVLGYAGDTIRQKFTDKERDIETGLDWFGPGRYYANVQGRVTHVDPAAAGATAVNPQTFNQYTYTLNRPTIAIDPDGLSTLVVTVTAPAGGGNPTASIIFSGKIGDNGTDAAMRYEGLATGQGRNRMVTDNDTPYGTYSFDGTEGGRADSRLAARFGTGKIIITGQSGEIIESARTFIRLHGGGTALGAQAYDLQQELLPTQGCVRMHNGDVNQLIGYIGTAAANNDPLDRVFIGSADVLNTTANQTNRHGTYVNPDLRLAMGLYGSEQERQALITADANRRAEVQRQREEQQRQRQERERQRRPRPQD